MKHLYLFATLVVATMFTLTQPVLAQVGGTDSGVPDQVYVGTNVTSTVTTTTPPLDGTVHVDGTVNHCGNVSVGGTVQHYGNVNHSGTIHVVYDQPRVVTHTVNRPVYRNKTVVVNKPVYVPVPAAAPPSPPVVQNIILTTTPATAPAPAPAPTAAEIAAAAAAKEQQDKNMMILLGIALIAGAVIAIIALSNTNKVDLAKIKVDQDTLSLGKTAIEKVADVKDGDMTASVSQGNVSVGKTLQTVAAGTQPLHQTTPQGQQTQQLPPTPPQGANFSDAAWQAYMAQGQRTTTDRVLVREQA